MQQGARRLNAGGPTLALLVDLRTQNALQLRELADSLKAQLYTRWELWFIVPYKSSRVLDWMTRYLCGPDKRFKPPPHQTRFEKFQRPERRGLGQRRQPLCRHPRPRAPVARRPAARRRGTFPANPHA